MTHEQMPGNGGLPVIGRTYAFLSGRLMASTELYDRYGPVSWSHAVGKTWVHAEGPEACGAVLQDRDKAFDASGWSLMIGPFFNRGLMLLDGAEHHRHRHLMQEAFTADRLRSYLAQMNDTVAAALQDWPTGRQRFYPAVKQLTLDVATHAFMAADVDRDGADRLNHAFVDAVRAGTAVIRKPVPRLRWSRGLAGRKVLEDYLRPRVAAAREGSGSDLFSALCHARADDGETFTDEDVVNHMIFLLMAAHDTSTITLTTMAYYLARHPEWQERCRAESLALDSPTADYDALEQLTSLDLVMKEALRLVAPVPVLVRRTNHETELLGYRIPAGRYVAAHLWGVHHLPDVWPEPYRFDPERFAEHRREDKVHRFAYVPFGGGIHKCIGLYFGGMEVKAVMHQLLLRYRLTLPPGYRMPLDWSSLPRPRDGLPIELHPLHSDVARSPRLTRATG
jgi:cytochrome P450